MNDEKTFVLKTIWPKKHPILWIGSRGSNLGRQPNNLSPEEVQNWNTKAEWRVIWSLIGVQIGYGLRWPVYLGKLRPIKEDVKRTGKDGRVMNDTSLLKLQIWRIKYKLVSTGRYLPGFLAQHF